jgi:hypothetical protein
VVGGSARDPKPKSRPVDHFIGARRIDVGCRQAKRGAAGTMGAKCFCFWIYLMPMRAISSLISGWIVLAAAKSAPLPALSPFFSLARARP